MKTFTLSLFLLLTLAGCNEGDKLLSETKSCTLNGEAIDCNKLDAYENRMKPNNEKAFYSLSATVKGQYSWDGRYLRATIGDEHTETKVVNGTNISCTASWPSNMKFLTTFNSEGLIITDAENINAKSFLKRISSSFDPNYPIAGIFTEELGNEEGQTKITFDVNGNVTVVAICNFELN